MVLYKFSGLYQLVEFEVQSIKTDLSNMTLLAQTSHKTAAGIVLVACSHALSGLQETSKAAAMREEGLKSQITSLQQRLQKSQAGEQSSAEREVLLKTQLQRELLHANVNALSLNRLGLQIEHMQIEHKVGPGGIRLFCVWMCELLLFCTEAGLYPPKLGLLLLRCCP